MIFKIDYTNSTESRNLIYREEEYSFDMAPWSHIIDFELALNKLTLSVLENKIIQISGFCGLTKEMNSEIEIPKYKRGVLKVEHNLVHGFAYSINTEELPVRSNAKTGWICIGATNKVGQGVEFIENCVAIISDTGDFLSLWLKPKEFPNL